ncbi:MAG: hypothetical protein VCC00_08005 [Deltaproteobacteria bacterium]
MANPVPLRDRPLWLNAAFLVCVFIAFIYSPWDYFSKPVAHAEDVWFGIVLRGETARLTEPIHFLIYVSLVWGLWQMAPWMRVWGTLYLAQMTIAFAVWPLLDERGSAWMALPSLLIWGGITWRYWLASELFTRAPDA